MERLPLFLGCCTLAYLLGSIPFGKIIGRMRGVDIQKKGSGNIGFANAVRVLGWKPAVFVLLGDALKGFLAVKIVRGQFYLTPILVISLFALAGHCFPIWLKFKGGKGIATGLGITLALIPRLGLLGMAVYVLVMAFARKSAVASLVSAWSLPIMCLIFYPYITWYFLILAVFATWTHQSNIRQMMAKKITYDD